MTAVRDLFDGRKTYLVGVGLIAYALVGYWTGKTPELDLKTIGEGLGAITLRAAITKAAA